jgi:metacaspase-1
MTKDFALLQVGINTYSGAPLRGCRNDCINLINRFERNGWKPSWHKYLYDRDATRQGIIESLAALITRPERTLIFQYSGHGTRIRDVNGDETSGYDSAICPVDFFEKGPIIDDDLAAIYDMVPFDSRLIVLFDSCFSGKSQRAFTLKVKAAFKRNIQRYLPEDQIPTKVKKLTIPGIRLTTRRSFLENNERCVLISTAKETQTSADAYINGKWQGAGTAALLYAWDYLGMNALYKPVAQVANKWLKDNGYEQVLRVEGRAENEVKAVFS